MRGVENNFDNTQRLNGFRDVLKRAGIVLLPDYIIDGEYETDAAYHSMKKFMDEMRPLPEAVFAANDLSAIGVIEALTEEGIRVPEDVSVVGCDDIEIVKLLKPSVTTVRTSFEKQGALSVARLIDLIKGEKKGTIDILQGRVIPRESTCVRE